MSETGPAMKRIYFLVHGTVQGVFFRKHTKQAADAYGLTGFVRNTPQGKVEGEAQGTEEGIQKLLKDLDKGSKGSHVIRVDKVEREDVVDGEDGFEIRR